MKKDIRMSRRTGEAIQSYIARWKAIYSVPGTVPLVGSLRSKMSRGGLVLVAVQDVTREAAVSNYEAAERAFAKMRFTKNYAHLDLMELDDDDIMALRWAISNVFTGIGAQHAALDRLARELKEHLERHPLIRLAECAE